MAEKRKIYKTITPITNLSRINAANRGVIIPKDAKWKIQLPGSKIRGQDATTTMVYGKTKGELRKALKEAEAIKYVKPLAPYNDPDHPDYKPFVPKKEKFLVKKSSGKVKENIDKIIYEEVLGSKNHPETYEKTGKIVKKYKPFLGPDNVTIAGQGADTLEEAEKFVADYFEKNPKQIRVRDPEKEKRQKQARNRAIRKNLGVVDYKTGTVDSPQTVKGHATNIYGKNLITPQEIIYTPEAINALMAGKIGKKGKATRKSRFAGLDHRRRNTEEKIEKIKKSNMPLDKKKILLGKLDDKLVEYVGMSDGYLTATLSDGTKYGKSFQSLRSMDPMGEFPGWSEKDVKSFVNQWKDKKIITEGPNKTPANEIENIKKAFFFEENANRSLAQAQELYKDPEFKKAMEETMNEVAGRKICRDGCFIKVGKNNPGLIQKVMQKLAGKGGRLGALVAGLGAVGAGTYAMMGDATADETGITDQSMEYNSTTGEFVNTETGDPETQQGVLNWIADNPGKSGFAALPIMLGAGQALAKAGLPGGRYLTSWKAAIPAMMIPEKMWQWKEGKEVGEMITDPLNALWALGIETKADMVAAQKWYNSLPEGQRTRLMSMQNLKDLKTTQGWKNLPSRLRTAILSPTAAGTDLAFQKRLKPATKKLTEAIIGSPGAKQVAKKGLGALAKRAAIGLGAAALLPATVAAGLLSAPLTLGLGALSFGYAQYKDYRDGKKIVDSMRARGKISEEDANNYMSLILQGSLPFGLGNRLFGDQEMTLRGQTLDPTQQRAVLKGMEDQIDIFQYGDPDDPLVEGRQEVRALDRADDFDFFNEGGRVGLAGGGGMDRRGFLKWLMGLGAGVVAGASGLFKTGAKKGIEQVVKQAPKQFVGVEGMPAWFPRAVAKIKTHGKLVEMADKDYVNGDIYEMMIPVKVKRSLSGRPGHDEIVTVDKKVLLEENPVSGEIEISWNVDDFDGDMKRQINFRPGETGFQKFGVDPEHPGAWQYERVKVSDAEFTYGNPNQADPERADFDFQDIFEEGDEVVKGLENLTGNKKMVAKDGSIIETTDAPDVDEAFKKKMFKDIEGEGALQPDPEGHMTPEGWSGEGTQEVVGGDVPDWVPKDTWQKKAKGGRIGYADQGLVGTPTDEVTQYDRRVYMTPTGEEVSEKSVTIPMGGMWINIPSIHDGREYGEDQLTEMILRGEIEPTTVHENREEAQMAAIERSNMMKRHKKGFNTGGEVETGAIARRQSLVPPLAGPNPQGIMGLPSDVKQVRVG